MRYLIHPQARQEVVDAALYYETKKSGLGDEFVDEYLSGIDSVLEAPNRWPQIESGIRRYRLDRFPFGLIYTHRLGSDLVTFFAVMELHRKPGYWRNRID